MDQDFYVQVGDQVAFTKTISESDVYLFAGITGDFGAIHVNAERMKNTAFGERLVHGALVVGLMSTASSMLVEKFERPKPGVQSYAVGYDRVRFTKPVFFGDTVTVTYRVDRIDHARQRACSKVEATNQRGELVAVAEHLIQWVGP